MEKERRMTRDICPAPLAYRQAQVTRCSCRNRDTQAVTQLGVPVVLIEKRRQNRVGILRVFARNFEIVV